MTLNVGVCMCVCVLECIVFWPAVWCVCVCGGGVAAPINQS